MPRVRHAADTRMALALLAALALSACTTAPDIFSPDPFADTNPTATGEPESTTRADAGVSSVSAECADSNCGVPPTAACTDVECADNTGKDDISSAPGDCNDQYQACANECLFPAVDPGGGASEAYDAACLKDCEAQYSSCNSVPCDQQLQGCLGSCADDGACQKACKDTFANCNLGTDLVPATCEDERNACEGGCSIPVQDDSGNTTGWTTEPKCMDQCRYNYEQCVATLGPEPSCDESWSSCYGWCDDKDVGGVTDAPQTERARCQASCDADYNLCGCDFDLGTCLTNCTPNAPGNAADACAQACYDSYKSCMSPLPVMTCDTELGACLGGCDFSTDSTGFLTPNEECTTACYSDYDACMSPSEASPCEAKWNTCSQSCIVMDVDVFGNLIWYVDRTCVLACDTDFQTCVGAVDTQAPQGAWGR